jgi:IMP dehydrogenase
MRFLHEEDEVRELTYEDAFLLPQYSEIGSRMDVDVTPPDGVGTTIPIVISNMTSAAGKRMAETVTRRGGLVVLPQDMPLDRVETIVQYLKTRHPIFETPVMLEDAECIQTGLNLIHKRAHGAVIVIDKESKPVGVFTERDAEGKDRFAALGGVMSKNIVSANESITPRDAFDKMGTHHIPILPIIKQSGELLGVITPKGAVRSTIYKPALNNQGQFLTAVAMGISNGVSERAEALLKMGVDIFVVDTAHGHSKRMIDAIKRVRSVVGKDKVIYAGTVVTARGVEDLIQAGANIVKVGIGAGGSCITRMRTAHGRPQLSAVIECAKTARTAGAYIWSDAGIREPRDLALVLAAGASSAMWGTPWVGTYESPGDIYQDEDGRLYKINFGMASRRAVRERANGQDVFSQALKSYFEEGISEGKIYIKPGLESAEDMIDLMISGLRSALSYTGARNLEEFHEKAIFGTQTPGGFNEGKALLQY